MSFLISNVQGFFLKWNFYLLEIPYEGCFKMNPSSRSSFNWVMIVSVLLISGIVTRINIEKVVLCHMTPFYGCHQGWIVLDFIINCSTFALVNMDEVFIRDYYEKHIFFKNDEKLTWQETRL